eukprot:9491232-Pyramimonas_sp.AAC.3
MSAVLDYTCRAVSNDLSYLLLGGGRGGTRRRRVTDDFYSAYNKANKNTSDDRLVSYRFESY